MVPRLNRTILVGSLVGSLAAAGLGASIPPAPQERTLNIPVVGPAASVRCEYFAELVGDPPHAGATDWGRVASRPGAVVINTAPVGKPTTRLKKAFVYCPGFELAVLNDQPIPSASSRLPPISPAALPTVKLTGDVPWAPTDHAAGGNVDVLHYAYWIVESYGTWDGPIPQFRIASVPLSPDGTFSVELPDLARDPWVSKFSNHGWFQFTATIGRTTYRLQPSAHPALGHEMFERQGLVVPRGMTSMDVTFAFERRR